MSSVLTPSVSELDFHLKELVKWEGFALQLPNIKSADIQIILSDQKNDVQSQRRALYEKWLRVHPSASWDDVITALGKVDENTIAENLRIKLVEDAFLNLSKIQNNMSKVLESP